MAKWVDGEVFVRNFFSPGASINMEQMHELVCSPAFRRF